MRLRSLIVLVIAAIGLTSCSQEVTYTDQRYNVYDARKLSQCVDVCKSCMNGNNVTCNTSCILIG